MFEDIDRCWNQFKRCRNEAGRISDDFSELQRGGKHANSFSYSRLKFRERRKLQIGEVGGGIGCGRDR